MANGRSTFAIRSLLASVTSVALVALVVLVPKGAKGAEPALTTIRVASGLNNPVFLTAPPADHHRLFILEQNSTRIRIVKDGALLQGAFLDLTGLVATGGEWGLLGLAFHPDYASNGRFFVYYSRASDGAIVLARYQVTANPDIADLASGQVLLVQPKPFGNHNGGTIAFGPDGFLYLAFGDGGSGGDPLCNAQNLGILLGKVLRIDVDGAFPYAIPPTNPFLSTPGALGEIWARGVRNPYRFAFDRVTGDLYIGDVGQDTKEEIDVQPATSAGGLNFGWSVTEGLSCFGAPACTPGSVPSCTDPSLMKPITQYGHSQGDCAVVGGNVYRGCAISGLEGTYFFADYCSGRIWSLRWSNGTVSGFQERTAQLAPGGGLSINNVTAFGEDADGEIYIVDYDGEIYRIIANAPAPATDLGHGKVGGNGLVPQFSVCGLLDAGHDAIVRLRDAPASAAVIVAASLSSNPTPVLMGTFVPSLSGIATFTATTGSDGALEIDVLGGMGPLDVYAQCLIADPGASAMTGFSNALAIHFLP